MSTFGVWAVAPTILFRGLGPRAPATFVAPHSGCEQPECFADGLTPIVSAKTGLGGRLDCVHLFRGRCPRPPRPLSLPHSGCEQPECFADGLRPLYPQKVSAKTGLGGRLDCVHLFRGRCPRPPRPLSPLMLAASSQNVLRMGYAHCIRKNGARRSIGLRPFCFGGLAPGPPRPLSLPHSGCEQPECFADGLRPLYPQKVSAKTGLGGRLDCVHFVSGAWPPGPRDLCRPSFWLRAARMFCGWATPIVSAKTGLGGRLGFAHFVSGAWPPGPDSFCLMHGE